MVEPMVEIVPLARVGVDLDGVQAVLLTSANGVRALARTTPRRDTLLLAVGEATASAARAAGFRDVEAAGGDVEALAAHACGRLDPRAGPVVHVAGRTVAGDLAGTLTERGFMVRRAVLYEAHAATGLSDSLRAALEDSRLDAVLFFSPRTAQTFVNLVAEVGLEAALSRVEALCLSEAVVRAVGVLSWRRVRVASRPRQEAVLALLDETAGEAAGTLPAAPRVATRSGS